MYVLTFCFYFYKALGQCSWVFISLNIMSSSRPNLQLDDGGVGSSLLVLGVEQVNVPLGVVYYGKLSASVSSSLNSRRANGIETHS